MMQTHTYEIRTCRVLLDNGVSVNRLFVGRFNSFPDAAACARTVYENTDDAAVIVEEYINGRFIGIRQDWRTEDQQ